MAVLPIFKPFAKPARYKVAFGGRGCVHKDTLIDTPSGQVKISDFQGGEIFSYHNGKKITTLATKPKSYTVEDLYKVELDDGRSIVVTDQHRFLTQDGWKELRHLQTDLDYCVFDSSIPCVDESSLPQTTLDSDLLKSVEDALHCLEKLVSYQDDYSMDFHQYDRQLPLALNIAQAFLPSLSDGHEHNYHTSLREGVLSHDEGHTHVCQFFHQLETQGVLPSQAHKNCALQGNHIVAWSFELLLAFCQSAVLFHERNNLRQTCHESAKLLLDNETSKCLARSFQTIHDTLAFFFLCIFHHYKAYENSPNLRLYSYHNRHFKLAKIKKISKHCRDVYWDLHVPFYNNYLSNGIVNHNSGKSYNIAELLIEFIRRAPLRILCGRELQNSISDSVIQILSDSIDRLGYTDEFLVLKNKIIHADGGYFIFYGIKNNPTKIKSLEGIDICWIEEGENVSDESWDILIPTIRKPNSEIWVSFNPKNILDPTYQRFVVHPPKSETVLLQVNWDKNPYISQVLLDEKDDLKERDYDLYLHIWEGKPLADSAKAIIKYQWVEAAVDLHKKMPMLLDGTRQLGVDVADEGGDKNAIAYREGGVLHSIDEFGEGDTGQTSIKAWNKASELMCDSIIYDSIGVGAGVKAKLAELKRENAYAQDMRFTGFNASGEVENPHKVFVAGKTNRQMFSNLKAQAWWRLRERFQNTYLFITEGKQFKHDELISISSDIADLEELMSELSTPQLDYDNNGKIKVESKKDLAKRGIRSPNKADSVVMAFYKSQKPTIGLIC